MDKKPPIGSYPSSMDKYLLKKYRERSNFYRPKREMIYVDGERHFVNKYRSMEDSPHSPFARNYVLMNASPKGTGMLHVSRMSDVKHGWAPRYIETNLSVPATPQRCQSSLDLRRSETYASAEDLRYHAVRKAGSYDDILSQERYFSECPPSESGISDVDSIFQIDDDTRSESSLGSADRSYSFSEMDDGNLERLDVLDVINENEVLDDSGNQGSDAQSQTNAAVKRLSQGQINAGVLTEELLKLKEAQEKRKHRKAMDVKDYIENNYPKRNYSTTSHDSCLGDSIRTDIDHAEFGSMSSENGRFKSRRKLTYSEDSAFNSRHGSTRARNDSDEFVTTSIETTYMSDLPGVYQHELDTEQQNESVWTNNESNFHGNHNSTNNNYDLNSGQTCESEVEDITTSVETVYIQNGESVQFGDDLTDNLKTDLRDSYGKNKQSESDTVSESIETIYFNDMNTKLEDRDNEDGEWRISRETIYVSDKNSRIDDNTDMQESEALMAVETIDFEDQRLEIFDDSSISGLNPSEFLINEQTVSVGQKQMSEDNLFTTENVLNIHEHVNSVNSEDHTLAKTVTNQSERSWHTSEFVADDNKNSRHYLSIDKKPADDTKTTVVVYSELECRSRILSSSELNIDELTADYEYVQHEGRNEVCNLTSDDTNRLLHTGTNTVVDTEADFNQDINITNSYTITQKILDSTEQTRDLEIQYGDDLNDNGEASGEVENIAEFSQNWDIANTDCVEIKEISEHFSDNVTNVSLDIEKNGEQFIDNCKRFEQVDKTVIDNWKEETELGVDHKEYFTCKEVTRLESDISKTKVNTVIYPRVVNEIEIDNVIFRQEITTVLPFTERFIDRCEKFINQSDDRLIIKQNTTAHQLYNQVDFLRSSIDYSSRSGKITDNNRHSKADYTEDKEVIITEDSDIMDDGQENNWSMERNEEEEEWDNLEDFKPMRQSGIKISVTKTKNLTKYQMQTISEHDEVNFGASEFARMYSPNSEEDSEVVSNVVQSNGIQIRMTQNKDMNIANYRMAQQNMYFSNVTDMNTCDTEETREYSNTGDPQITADQSTVPQNDQQVPFLHSTNQHSHSSHTQIQNFNNSQEFYLPTPEKEVTSSTETMHYRNLTMGEIGNENMGKSFQFVRDRTDSPDEWLTTDQVEPNVENDAESRYESQWNRSTESFDISNLSLISQTSSNFYASCSAEVNDGDESGYVTYLQSEQLDSANQSFLDISHDSDSSAYRAVCTAEVNIEIPDVEDESQTMVSPLSEVSDAESGYYTLTRTGKVQLSRQDTSEDMTSFVSEDGGRTVYRAQMFGEMNEDGGVKLERALSSEDITSFADASESNETSHGTTALSHSVVKGTMLHRINSQEDITSFADVQNLQDVLNNSAESFGDVGEHKSLHRINSSEDMTSIYSVEAAAEISSDNFDTQSVSSIEQPSVSKKTVIELFDSSEDLTGCIEFEIDDDGSGDSGNKPRSRFTDANSTENLSRSINTDHNATSRKYSVDQMKVTDGSLIGIRRVNSSEDMTSFERTIDIFEHSQSTEELNTRIRESGLVKKPTREINGVNSSEDMTSFEETVDTPETSQNIDDLIAELEQTEILGFSSNQIKKVNSSEDITSFETITDRTERSQNEDDTHMDIQTSRTINVHDDVNEDDQLQTNVGTTYYQVGSNIHHNDANQEHDTTWTTTTEATTIVPEEWTSETRTFDIENQSTQYDEVDNTAVNFDSETTSRILQENQVTVIKTRDSESESWNRSLDSSVIQGDTKTLEENLYDLISSETGIDHAEKFASLMDKDRSKIQMFIIYQDFTQMRERARLKRQLAQLSEQFERLDNMDSSSKTVHLSKINSFLDNFLMNLKLTENLHIFKTRFERANSVQSVHYYCDNSEMHKLMEKFSQIIRELDMHRDDSKLSAKLVYCLSFLKTQTLDAQFDSLCDFVCQESQKEDIELLQNHLCLIKGDDFGSRRLLKYLGRGFSRDMKTIWKPKLRNTLLTVCEDTELFFNDPSINKRELKGDKPCCEFHSSDKGVCAELDLWSNCESVSKVSTVSENMFKHGIMS